MSESESFDRKAHLSPTKRALLESWLEGKAQPDQECIPKRPSHIPIPLSFPQQRQLFLELLEPGTAVNNLSVCLELRGDLDIESLEESANRILKRHDVLRARFSFQEGIPSAEFVQQFRISIPVIDLSRLDPSTQHAEAKRLAEDEIAKTFNLETAPLFRLTLLRLSSSCHWMVLVVHHTIGDGWSLGVFLRELIGLYGTIRAGLPELLSDLRVQYDDFAHWQRTEIDQKRADSSLTYWKKQLNGELSALELPTQGERPSRQTFFGAIHRFVLPAGRLKKFSQTEDVSPFMALVAVFAVLLYRYSGQNDILIGTPVANRNRPELENMIGVFINTLVLRVNVTGDLSYRELLTRVRETCLDAYAHQDFPFEKLVEELKPPRDLSRNPLFQVVFNLQNAPMPDLSISGLTMRFLELDQAVSQFDLTLMFSEVKGEFRATVEYNRDLFTREFVEQMFRSYQLLLEDVLEQPQRRIARMRVMPDKERRRLLSEWNQTEFEYPRGRCVHQLIEEQANATPDAVAVIFGSSSLTYRELNTRGSLLAEKIRRLGVEKNRPVGVYMERSLELPAALLAVWKAGKAFVPIDTTYPADRVCAIAEDADVGIVLTNVDPAPFVHGVTVVHVHQQQHGNVSALSPEADVPTGGLAYIIYTSGSTGKPKGVMVPHSALVNLLWSMRQRPGMSRNDVLLAVTSISFDISMLELFLPLIVGGTLVLAGKENVTDPSMLMEMIDRHHVTVMQATPTTWGILIDAGWRGSMKLKALCGGERLTPSLARRLRERVGSLWNMYGPTETTIWSALERIEAGDDPILIGRPVGNTRMHILDSSMQPLAVGAIGELYIGGDGLAVGYLNQEPLTSERFIPDPFQQTARLYRTGDRARYTSNGSIELLGRTDDQVKISGHRIELGEISSVLMQHASLREAVVTARGKNADEAMLTAYVVAKEGEPDTQELRRFLKTKLPQFMMPTAFVSLESIPRTVSGKINRRALPAAEYVNAAEHYVAPRNDMERMLTSIWEDVLRIKHVGIHDNFFDLGGASIQSLQVVAYVNAEGLRITPQALFEYQTIAELSSFLINGDGEPGAQADA